jgi:hypothetical protein
MLKNKRFTITVNGEEVIYEEMYEYHVESRLHRVFERGYTFDILPMYFEVMKLKWVDGYV